MTELWKWCEPNYLKHTFPSSEAIPFGPVEAFLAADIYKKLKRPRGREIDIAIAACAIIHEAQLWTASPADFKDIPNVKLLG